MDDITCEDLRRLAPEFEEPDVIHTNDSCMTECEQLLAELILKWWRNAVYFGRVNKKNCTSTQHMPYFNIEVDHKCVPATTHNSQTIGECEFDAVEIWLFFHYKKLVHVCTRFCGLDHKQIPHTRKESVYKMFVCKKRGVYHWCNENCPREHYLNRDSEYICLISSFMHGTQITMDFRNNEHMYTKKILKRKRGRRNQVSLYKDYGNHYFFTPENYCLAAEFIHALFFSKIRITHEIEKYKQQEDKVTKQLYGYVREQYRNGGPIELTKHMVPNAFHIMLEKKPYPPYIEETLDDARWIRFTQYLALSALEFRANLCHTLESNSQFNSTVVFVLAYLELRTTDTNLGAIPFDRYVQALFPTPFIYESIINTGKFLGAFTPKSLTNMKRNIMSAIRRVSFEFNVKDTIGTTQFFTDEWWDVDSNAQPLPERYCLRRMERLGTFVERSKLNRTPLEGWVFEGLDIIGPEFKHPVLKRRKTS